MTCRPISTNSRKSRYWTLVLRGFTSAQPDEKPQPGHILPLSPSLPKRSDGRSHGDADGAEECFVLKWLGEECTSSALERGRPVSRVVFAGHHNYAHGW